MVAVAKLHRKTSISVLSSQCLDLVGLLICCCTFLRGFLTAFVTFIPSACVHCYTCSFGLVGFHNLYGYWIVFPILSIFQCPSVIAELLSDFKRSIIIHVASPMQITICVQIVCPKHTYTQHTRTDTRKHTYVHLTCTGM